MDREKYIDESWKESAAKEKEILQKTKINKDGSHLEVKEDYSKTQEPKKENLKNKEPMERNIDDAQEKEAEAESYGNFELNFVNYITSLGYQAIIFLGEIPHPMTNETMKDLQQAKLLIDTIAMLKEKTKGNLSPQEEKLISVTLYELQMKYIEMSQKEGKND